MAKSRKKSRPRNEKQSSQVRPSKESTPSKKKPDKPPWVARVVFRESVEAVAIAFILAFLVRTFEAEAFVIPTGSMATTLMGKHKDVVCPQCGYAYRVGASDRSQSEKGEVEQGQGGTMCVCPMCGYEKIDARRERTYNGDRILVNKLVYCFQDPDRWDVAVFKYPEEAQTNYIKRIVGLPNETVKISRGNIMTRPDGADEFTIARKPPSKLRAMLKMVYDNDHVMPKKLLAEGWPARWQADITSPDWVAADDHKSFSNKGTGDQQQWLRYHHYVPSPEDWKAIDRNELRYTRPPKARLITDAYAYNDTSQLYPLNMGLNWVGDLAVSCTVDVHGTQGQFVIELVEGGQRMQCRFDIATGKAELVIPGTDFRRTATTPLAGAGTHELFFANVDDQLRLWVDDRLIEFDGPTTYGPLNNKIPNEADLEPVGIATIGADITVSHLKILRDIYYVAVNEPYTPMCDFKMPMAHFRSMKQERKTEAIEQFFCDPSRWPRAFSDDSMREVEFPLGKDRFFVLGDNSPQSKDGRLWDGPEYYVERELLIGKAMFIYWPHSWDKVSIGGADIPFPFFPNFKRMVFVR